MSEQETAGRLPARALMYALHDAFRRDPDALVATRQPGRRPRPLCHLL